MFSRRATAASRMPSAAACMICARSRAALPVGGNSAGASPSVSRYSQITGLS